MPKAVTPAVDPQLLALVSSAVASAVAEYLAKGVVPAAPAPAAAPAAPSTWAERAQDKVVASVDVNGMPRNRYGMTIKRDEAIFPAEVAAKYKRHLEGKVPPVERAKVAVAARRRVAQPSIRELLLPDGEGWLHCPECEAYWSASRDDAWLERKYRAHLKSPRHAGQPAHA